MKIGVDVSDNGTTQKMIKTVEKLHSLLKQTQQAAQGVNVGGAGGGGGTPPGSRTLAAASAASRPTMAMASQEVVEYGRMRGSAGATGASARDFANQAQGLGGLVRLYATFAANVFALSAAFGALRNAMDTTRMVEGLNMLGASTGQNLGSISKRLVDVTNGAISMREAMETVAKSTSAGMGQKDIERLAKVATNASAVLGVNLPDSMSRLTRAVTKLEPELLDELGIMTRIEPAVEAYARQVGKSASQLSQMERQQAFLNAVLAEGEQKFGEIGAALANPYDKLLATLKNVLQSGLEVINKVIAPIVSLLASSPSALALALGALGVALVRQALPALGQFKAGLAASADAATEYSKKRAEDARAAQEKINAQIVKDVESRADQEIQRVDAAEKRIQQLRTTSLSKNSAAYKLLQKTAQEVTDSELANVRKLADRYDRRGLKDVASAYREVADAQESSRKSEQDLSVVQRQVRDNLEKNITFQRTLTQAKEAETAATKKSIISNAAYETGLIGMRGAWRNLNAELEKSGIQMGRFESAAFKARAGIAVLGGAVAALGTALNAALGWIGLIVGAVAAIDAVFSSASKQISAANSALDTLDTNADTAERTLERLNKSEFGASSIQGINAISNSLRELSQSANDAISSTLQAQGAMGAWEKFTNMLASLFGKGLEKNLAKNIGKAVEQAIKQINTTPLAAEGRALFEQVLGISTFDEASVSKAFAKLSEQQQDNFGRAFIQISNQVSESGNRLNTFKTAVESTTKSYQEFIQSTANTNPLFRLGSNLEDLAISMQNLTNKGLKEIDAALISFAKDPSKVSIFGPEFAKDFTKINKEFLESAERIQMLDASLEDLDARIRAVSKPIDGTTIINRDLLKTLEAYRDVVQGERIKVPIEPIIQARKLFAEAIENAFEKSSKFIKQALGEASEKAAITLSRARLEGLSGARRVEEEIRLQRQEIDIQLRAVDTNIDLILSQERLTATIEESNALQELAKVRASQTTTPEQIQAAEIRQEVATAVRFILQNSAQGLQQLTERVVNMPREGKSGSVVSAQIRSRLTAPIRQTAQQEATAIGIRAQGEVIDLIEPLRLQKARNQEAEKLVKLTQDVRQQELALLNTVTSITGETTRLGIELQNQYDTQALTNKLQQEANRLAEREEEIQRLGNDQETLKQFNLEKEQIIKRQGLEILDVEAKKRQRTINLELQETGRRFELERARQALADNQNQLRLDYLQEEFNAYNQLYGTVEGFTLLKQDQLQRDKARLDVNRALAEAESNIEQKRQEAATRMAGIDDPTSEKGVKLAAAINEELGRQEQLNQLTQSGLVSQYAQRLAILDLTKQTNQEQERYNSFLANATGAAESLAKVFGNVGESVGGVVTSFAQFVVNADKGSQALKQIETAQSKTVKGSKAYNDLEEQRQNQITQNTKQELTGAANVAGATKKLFKEKTVAYKLLANVEKVLHLTRLAMDAKELAVKLGFLSAGTAAKVGAETAETAATGAGFLARVPIYISEIFAKFTAMLGPFGPPIAAAAIAAIGLAAFGGRGGGGAAKAYIPTAEERQQTQGTAMGYNAQGQQVQVRRGVFGDTEAKSQSIDNSLKIIKENSVDGLSYQNRMLLALEKLNKSIEGAAQGLFRIPGIRTGTMFGTETGTQTLSTGFLGASWLGGKSQTKEIVDSGLLIKGSFLDLANGAKNTLQVFETLQTTVKRSGVLGFGKKTTTTRDTVFTDLFGVDPKAAQNISKAFDYGRDLLVSVAEFSGIGEQAVNTILQGVRLEEFASLRGLKGEDFTKELQAVIGSILDDASLAIFSTFEDYAKFGEGMLETVVRVTDTNKKVTQALKNVGFETLGAQSFAITESLVDAAGGTEEFLSLTENFRQNFLDEAQRLRPIQESVTQELNRLGLGFVKTKDQFAQALTSLDVIANQTDRDTFVSLLKIQDNFLKVAQAAEQASEKILQEQQGLNKRLLELQGETLKLREMELEVLDPSNRALQQRIWALEDEQKILQERQALERKILELQGKTQEIRQLELANISENNKLLQERIYALEDLKSAETNLTTAQDKVKQIQDRATDAYVQAQEKVAQAQEQITNQAIEAAKQLRDLGKTLKEFVLQQLGLDSQINQNVIQFFRQTVSSALTGNQQALSEVQGLAEQAIQRARETSGSAAEFNNLRREILSSVISVANFAEQQSKKTAIPEENPAVLAKQALDNALLEQAKALLTVQTLGASLQKTVVTLEQEYQDAIKVLNTAIDERTKAEETAKLLALNFEKLTDGVNKLSFNIATGNNLTLTALNSRFVNGIYYPPDFVGPLPSQQTSSPVQKLLTIQDFQNFVAGRGNAMGNKFDYGIMRYAQGGSFTNQIVDNPTAFRLGVMGEAGPEAIMPLTRIGGELGVRAEVPQFAQPQQNNAQLLQEIVKLRKEVENLRVEARVTAVSSNKTYRLFERITTDGEALNVVTVS